MRGKYVVALHKSNDTGQKSIFRPRWRSGGPKNKPTPIYGSRVRVMLNLWFCLDDVNYKKTPYGSKKALALNLVFQVCLFVSGIVATRHLYQKRFGECAVTSVASKFACTLKRSLQFHQLESMKAIASQILKSWKRQYTETRPTFKVTTRKPRIRSFLMVLKISGQPWTNTSDNHRTYNGR